MYCCIRALIACCIPVPLIAQQTNLIKYRASFTYQHPALQCLMKQMPTASNIKALEQKLHALPPTEIDVNSQHHDLGYSPLIQAAEVGSLKLVKLFVLCGAQVNATNSIGQTALMKAAHHGKYEMVKFLVQQKGIALNYQDVHGWSALTYAAAGNHTHIIQLLLQQGADSTIKDKFGRTLATIAHEHSYTRLTSQWLQNEFSAFQCSGKSETTVAEVQQDQQDLLEETPSHSPLSGAASQTASPEISSISNNVEDVELHEISLEE